MGMAVGGKKGLAADINVVPLVDITLVLLIIFMVMTPMMQRGYDMSIPEKNTVANPVPPPPGSQQLVVEVRRSGAVILNGKEKANTDRPDELEALRNELNQHVKGKPLGQRIVFFKAEDECIYQDAITVMDVIRAAEGTVGLVTTE